MVGDNFRVCLHTCHKENPRSRRPSSVKNIQIFLQCANFRYHLITTDKIVPRESNSSTQHKNTHGCSEDNPCSPVPYRLMENDDWVKFGFVIWNTRDGKHKDHVLELYQRAWRQIYKSEPLLVNGGPADFLPNPQYICQKPVPWLPAVNAAIIPASTAAHSAPLQSQPGMLTSPHIRVDQSSAAGPVALSDPAALLPGTSTSCDSGMAYSSTPSDRSHTENYGNPDKRLEELLLSASPKIVYSLFHKIQDGFFPGFDEHLANPSKTRLRAVFALMPQYSIFTQDNQPTPNVDFVDVDQEDMDVISKAQRGCLYRAKDQDGCAPGKVRCFCVSWVSPPPCWLVNCSNYPPRSLWVLR